MSRICTICHHTDAPVIDQQLDQGIPYRQLAQRYGVSKSSLVRHTQHSMPQADHVPGHVDQETQRPALAPATAEALRQEIENLRRVIEAYPHTRQQEYYLCYALGIMLKMIDALSRF